MSSPLVAIDALPGARAPAPSVWRELLALARLAVFRRVQPGDITGRDSTLALLAGAALVAWIIIDPLVHARDLVFSWYAVPDLAFIATLTLTLAWLLARLSRPALEFRRVLALTLAALPLPLIGEVASWKLTETGHGVLTLGLSLYGLAYFTHGLRSLTGRNQPAAVFAGALATAAFVVSLDYLQANPRLWTRADERLDERHLSGAEWASMLRAQFTQQARIDADVGKLAPQTPGVTDWFFLGFAGYGRERVFAREIGLAAEVVGEKYGARERSLRLVNDRRDLETWPIASEPGLRHALHRLGKLMGEEDVLFLALSSHGDRGRGLHVSSPGMPAARLSPDALAGMLREAGIGRRVIVVSACYSGSFVRSLADENAIVISAAAPDRKSFGCNDRRELTYFGEAFFRDAMRGTGSLRSAFASARVALEKKERAAGILSSMPQASFGARLEAQVGGAPDRPMASH